MGGDPVVEARPFDKDTVQDRTDLQHRAGQDLENLIRCFDVGNSFRRVEHDLTVAGYTVCKSPGCGAFVLNEVAYKTLGHCGPCFRVNANTILEAAITVVAGCEKLVLRTNSSNRSPGDRAQRRRAKKRAKTTAKAKQQHKKVAVARLAADRRLRALFPELWEVLLADERAKVGLNDWTIDRALTPGTAERSLDFVKAYHHV